MMAFRFCLLLSVLVGWTQELFAWGMLGHRIVAEIADRQLTPRAKVEVKKLLGGENMARAANFPDDMKSHPDKARWEPTFVWHYVNIPAGYSGYDEAPKNPAGDAVSALENLMKVLKDSKQPKEQRVEALKFIIHIVGDMHQPFHSGYPEDRGGGTCLVKWFKAETNLHVVWDEKLIEHQLLSYTEYTNWLLGLLTREQRQEWTPGDIRLWIKESLEVRDHLYPDPVKGEPRSYCRYSLKDPKAVAPVEERPELSWKYNYDHKALVEKRLTQAGLRLGRMLNEILDPKYKGLR